MVVPFLFIFNDPSTPKMATLAGCELVRVMNELKDLSIVLHFIMVGLSAWLQWQTDYPPA
jgi:hypothetical protein